MYDRYPDLLRRYLKKIDEVGVFAVCYRVKIDWDGLDELAGKTKKTKC